MTTKTTTICGKEVTLAYCYGTEIAFKKLTGKNIFQFDKEDQEQRISLVYAAAYTYSKSKDEEPPITVDDMMYNAKPMEVIECANDVINLGNEWYYVPADEPKDEDTGESSDEKNA